MAKVLKKRNWTAVVYPESLPTDWKDKLQATGLQVAISPLHDKDVSATGETKKPHYHLILVFDGPTTLSNVQTVLAPLNGPNPQALDGVRGMYRYFTHKDNPEKAQYDEKDIQCLNGFSIAEFIELSKAEVGNIIKDIQTYIVQNDIYELADLADALLGEGLMNEYNVLINHTYFIDKYISSRRNKKRSAGI